MAFRLFSFCIENMKISGNLPSSEAIPVEFPGHVQNIDKACAAMGGINKLMKVSDVVQSIATSLG